MKTKSYVFLSILACTTFTCALKAETKGCCCPTHTASTKPQFYLDVGVGHAFDSHIGSSNFTVLFDPITPVLFSLSAANKASPDNLLIGAGFLWPQPYQANSPYFPFLSLGVQYQYTNFDNQKTFMQFNLTPLDQQLPTEDHSHYIFSQNSLFANLKLDLYRWGRVMPYLNLGLGASWNQTKQHDSFTDNDETSALDSVITPTARTTAFSYNVGAGFDFLVTERFWLSLGYSYNNFGRVQIGKLTTVTDPAGDPPGIQPFNLGNLTTQNVQLTGRYVFG